MNFNYYIPTKILFGRGQLGNLHKEVMPGKKALIVISAGKSTKANGYLDRVEKEMEKCEVETVVFDKILPNPVKEHVMEGASLAKSAGCDFVIGLGGGSSIDSAKAIAVMAVNSGDYWDYISGGTGKGMPVPNDPLPIIAITTTAGTGTEADPWAVITKSDTYEKIGFGYDKTYPVLSVVDPELMITVPKELTAYQGFDALFHSTEGYLNNIAYPVSDAFSLKAIELIAANITKAVHDGQDLDAREAVALGNTLAGMVESTSGCTSEHSMEHVMSAHHPHLPHGAGLIMVSEAYYTHFANTGVCDQRMIDMAKAMGRKDADKPMDFVEALIELQKACDVYGLKMSDYGITREELPSYVKEAKDTMGGLFEVDPAPVSDADCLSMFEAAYK